MKKILIIALSLWTLSSIGFARMHDSLEDMNPTSLHMMKTRDRNYKLNAELERSRILIEEKKLEIRKELLNEKPDWNKIEKLNIEIATQEAKNKTCNMRKKFEERFESTSSNSN